MLGSLPGRWQGCEPLSARTRAGGGAGPLAAAPWEGATWQRCGNGLFCCLNPFGHPQPPLAQPHTPQAPILGIPLSPLPCPWGPSLSPPPPPLRISDHREAPGPHPQQGLPGGGDALPVPGTQVLRGQPRASARLPSASAGLPSLPSASPRASQGHEKCFTMATGGQVGPVPRGVRPGEVCEQLGLNAVPKISLPPIPNPQNVAGGSSAVWIQSLAMQFPAGACPAWPPGGTDAGSGLVGSWWQGGTPTVLGVSLWADPAVPAGTSWS